MEKIVRSNFRKFQTVWLTLPSTTFKIMTLIITIDLLHAMDKCFILYILLRLIVKWIPLNWSILWLAVEKRVFLLTPCVIFVFFWHFRFSSICYAWWQSNNDIRVIVLPYICWCPKGVILTIIVKCWTKWSLTSQSWTLDQSFRLSLHF